MTRLMIHWHLVHGADGTTHLGMEWESTCTCLMPSHSRPQSISLRQQIASRSANTWHQPGSARIWNSAFDPDKLQ
jgi:hypothetical protein